MRYEMGPSFDRPAVVKPVDVTPAIPAVKKVDVEPELFWDDSTNELSLKTSPYKSETECVPSQALVFLLPAGSPRLKSTAAELVGSPLDRTTTPLPTDEAGGMLATLPLPKFDDSLTYVGQVVYGYIV